MAITKEKVVSIIEVPKITWHTITFQLLGQTPLIMNQMSETAKHELWLPGRRKNKAELAARLKHDPYREFKESLYQFQGTHPTRLYFPAIAFRRTMEDATLDFAGAAKTEIKRLTDVFGTNGSLSKACIYGIPRMHVTMVRQSGKERTPDFRTRAIIEEWCCEIAVRFMTLKLSETSVFNLLDAGGNIQAVGDNRAGKSGGENGKFRVVRFGDKEAADAFKRIQKTGGREAQDKAIKSFPRCTTDDGESERMLAWYDEAVILQGKQGLLQK